MIKFKLLFLLSLFFFIILSSSVYTATIYIPVDYNTIQLGINNAQNGDTILVAPGTYVENIDFSNKSIYLIGSGSDSTILTTYLIDVPIIIINNPYAVVEIIGFTITGVKTTNAFRILMANKVLIKNNYFIDNLNSFAYGAEVISCSFSDVTITNNLFYGNNGIGCVGLRFGAGNSIIANNTFDNNERGFYSIAGGGTAVNNIVTNSNYGINAGASSDWTYLDYNNSWNNNNNYGFAATPGPNSISVNPLYVDDAIYDYNLFTGSPCIDAGSPEPQFNDVDGTRNDMGCFTFFQIYPIALNLMIQGNISSNVIDHTPTFTWQFFEDMGSQFLFELEVGTDYDWSVAELMSTGLVGSNDSFYIYDGPTLVDGNTYYYRVRLNNGNSWGGWAQSYFRMNRKPSSPILNSPLNLDTVHFLNTVLSLSNSTDPDYDPLYCDFEVFSDPLLTDLIWSERDVYDIAPHTQSSLLNSLSSNRQYWWRARCYDGYEYSNWSELGSFLARGSKAFHVPGEYNSIQEAINQADVFDTILVDTGIYVENIVSSDKSLFLIGVGREQSILQPLYSNSSTIEFTKTQLSNVRMELEIDGFTICNSGASNTVSLNSIDTVNIRNCTFHGNIPFGSANIEVISCNNTTAIIRKNLFYNNGGIGCIGLRSGSNASQIINNTFDNNERGFFTVAGGGTAINNNVTNNIYGINSKRSDEYNYIGYNNVWNNDINYGYEATAGINDISVDPEYADPVGNHYLLLLTSPCIDSGHPDSIFNDADGSRSDIGYSYKMGNYPPEPFSCLNPQGNPYHELLPTFIWHKALDINEEDFVRYRLIVSTDNNFNFIHTLDSIIDTTYNFHDSLNVNQMYWWKVVATDLFGYETESEPVSFKTWKLGDITHDGDFDISDLLLLVDYMFSVNSPSIDPLFIGDVNSDCSVDILDLIFLINYMFLPDMPEPALPCDF